MSGLVPGEHVHKFLRDSQGGVAATGDYSETPEEFCLLISDRSVLLHTLLVVIADVGVFPQSGYGSMAALKNGIRAWIKEGDRALLDLTDGEPIRSNAAWSYFAFDEWEAPLGPGVGSIVIRWKFPDLSGVDLKLAPGQRIALELSDDFTGLETHLFIVGGSFAEGG